MKLPVEQVVIEREKIVEYLLDSTHPDNGGKARFFLSFGFTKNDWEVLADALRKLAAEHTIAKEIESLHGRKYVLDGIIKTPSGKMASVRTIWIMDRGLETARLVTAYPHEA